MTRRWRDQQACARWSAVVTRTRARLTCLFCMVLSSANSFAYLSNRFWYFRTIIRFTCSGWEMISDTLCRKCIFERVSTLSESRWRWQTQRSQLARRNGFAFESTPTSMYGEMLETYHTWWVVDVDVVEQRTHLLVVNGAPILYLNATF